MDFFFLSLYYGFYFSAFLHAYFVLDTRDEFYLVGFWIFLCYVNILKLCSGTVKLLGNSLIVLQLVFKLFNRARTLFCPKLICPYY